MAEGVFYSRMEIWVVILCELIVFRRVTSRFDGEIKISHSWQISHNKATTEIWIKDTIPSQTIRVAAASYDDSGGVSWIVTGG